MTTTTACVTQVFLSARGIKLVVAALLERTPEIERFAREQSANGDTVHVTIGKPDFAQALALLEESIEKTGAQHEMGSDLVNRIEAFLGTHETEDL